MLIPHQTTEAPYPRGVRSYPARIRRAIAWNLFIAPLFVFFSWVLSGRNGIAGLKSHLLIGLAYVTGYGVLFALAMEYVGPRLNRCAKFQKYLLFAMVITVVAVAGSLVVYAAFVAAGVPHGTPWKFVLGHAIGAGVLAACIGVARRLQSELGAVRGQAQQRLSEATMVACDEVVHRTGARMAALELVGEIREDTHALLERGVLGTVETRPSRERVISRTGGRIHPVEVEDVTHFAAEDKLTFAVTSARRFVVNETLDQLQETLGRDFFRIHRRTLVKLAAVEEIYLRSGGTATLRLKNDPRTELAIARDRLPALKRALEGD